MNTSRKLGRGAAIGATVTLLTSALAATALASGGTPHHTATAKPTVVLVHGAFADSSSWNGVIKRLQRDGYPVVAPANPLRGLASDAAYLKSVLKSVKGPIVLAGHSYGGSVISQAAADVDQVKALVYIAGFIPDVGENALELSGKFPGSTLGETLNPVTFPLADGTTGTDLYIKQDKYRAQFAADVPASDAAVFAATQRPVATAALEERATKAAWKSIPSYALLAKSDKNIPVAAERWMAERAGARTVQVDASHAVTVSRPGAVTDLIQSAARTVRN
ncbi:alpha/beta fold hydrolase [Streptomyces sp. NPDC002870]|uniref:alpha/beta fold hydrolase n=1 Tax=Streptomyces sp. NPDC002870 TaxID=3364666 RepID=UPI0036888557